MADYFSPNNNSCRDFEEYLYKHEETLIEKYAVYCKEYGGPAHLMLTELGFCADRWNKYLEQDDEIN